MKTVTDAREIAGTANNAAMTGTLEAALKREADDLMNLAEYSLRGRPRALHRVRLAYKQFCLLAYRAIGRART
jgi:hypothetical protein